MFDDEAVPHGKSRVSLGDNLSALSIEELEERRDNLHAEIARIEAELVAKQAGKAAAEAIFKQQH